MKTLFAITLLLVAAASSTDNNQKTMDELWSKYKIYESQDKPKDQAETLEKIIAEAEKHRLSWDFYEAWDKYVTVRTRSNWKLREDLRASMAEAVGRFDEPVVTVSFKDFNHDVIRNLKSRLEAAHNAKFYESLNRAPVESISLPWNFSSYLRNDYEFCLWRQVFWTSIPDTEMTELFASRYPLNAIAEYLAADGRVEALEAHALKYAGRAGALLSRQRLLSERLDSLERSNAGQAAFLALEQDCETFEKERKSLAAGEKELCEVCTGVKSLLSRLRSKEMEIVSLEGSEVTMTLRNVDSFSFELTDHGKKSFFSTTVNNPARSFHVMDTVKVGLPALDDGEYRVFCRSGKEKIEGCLNRYSISIAIRRDADGMSVFAADSRTGEPINSYSLILRDNSDRPVAEARMTGGSGGFVRLPSNLTSKMGDRKMCSLQAKLEIPGQKRRLSREESIYGSSALPKVSPGEEKDVRCVLLTDRSAYVPGDTVKFKAIAYSGTTSHVLAEAGTGVFAEFYDTEGNTVASMPLTISDFGSVAGEFAIPAGRKGGLWRISVQDSDRRRLTSQIIRVDEFVLPTFDLEWAPDDRIWIAGETMVVRGKVRSFSGHGLAAARASWSVERFGESYASGVLELSGDGSFEVSFPSREEGHSSYELCVKVSEGTGETLEFRCHRMSMYDLPMNVEIVNSASGSAQMRGDYGYMSIVSEEILKTRIRAYMGMILAHPGLEMRYSLLMDGLEVSSGILEAADGGIDLTGVPSGVVELKVDASLRSESGRICNGSTGVRFLHIEDGCDSLAVEGMESLYLDGTDELSLRVCSTTGDVWVALDLCGDGGHVLASRLEHITKGCLATVGFGDCAGLSGRMCINAVFFQNNRVHSHRREIFPAKTENALPLGFTRFFDTTLPGREYSLVIRTEADAECAAAIFDAATEKICGNGWPTVTPGNRHPIVPTYEYRQGEEQAYGSTYIAFGGRRMLKMSRHATLGSPNSPVMYDSVEEVCEEEGAAVSSMDMGGSSVPVRENFAATVAWEPFLHADENGEIVLNFRNGDKLSKFVVQLFAHDRNFRNSVLRREMTVTLPVKVSVQQPQILREGDRYVARMTVSNSTSETVRGMAMLRFIDGADREKARTIEMACGELEIPAGGSAEYSCPISVVEGISGLGVLAAFETSGDGQVSDAMFVSIPVLPGSQEIVESHSAVLHVGEDRDALVSRLRGEFVNADGGLAEIRETSILQMIREALPARIEPRSENALDLADALYAISLARVQTPGDPHVGPMGPPRDDIAALLKCRNADGGFAWIAGFRSSPVVTATLLERFHAMGDDCPNELRATISEAVKFLDRSYFGTDSRMPLWLGCIGMEQYLHTRVLFPHVPLTLNDVPAKRVRDFRKATREYLVPSRWAGRGLNGEIFAKARRAETLEALSRSEASDLASALGIAFTPEIRRSLAADIESLAQYAQPHRDGGIYYPNAVMPFRGLLESELYAHNMLCRLMQRHGHGDIAEGIRLWLMIQKETQQWESDPAYIEAIANVLDGTPETLATRVVSLSASAVKPFEEVKASGNGFTLDCVWLRDGKLLQDGDTLHVGDRVTAEYRIWNAENRSFIRLSVPRAASLRPVEQLSGHYGWWPRPLHGSWYGIAPQGYRSVHVDRTDWWFDCYPEEKTTVTEDFFVTQEGSFRSPVPVIESLYAPHYRANAAGGAARCIK